LPNHRQARVSVDQRIPGKEIPIAVIIVTENVVMIKGRLVVRAKMAKPAGRPSGIGDVIDARPIVRSAVVVPKMAAT
jgi:hypothetical protein